MSIGMHILISKKAILILFNKNGKVIWMKLKPGLISFKKR